ncbi:transposase [Castellaniella sp. WN]
MHQDPTSKPRRRRRTYAAQFKTNLVAQCMDPAVSLAAVAIEHDLNPNVLRRWVSFQPTLTFMGGLPAAGTCFGNRVFCFFPAHDGFSVV